MAEFLSEDHPAVVAAGHFVGTDAILGVAPLGRGLINDSYHLRLKKGGSLLLQRLNSALFPRPELLLHNLQAVGDHLREKQQQTRIEAATQIIGLIPTLNGANCWQAPDQSCWRALEFVENSRPLTSLTPALAREAGAALGRFHCLLYDLPPARLYDPLPVFHVIPSVLAGYHRLQSVPAAGPAAEIAFCRRFIEERQAGAALLEQARARGVLNERVIHGDPKLDNILFDQAGERALALVDFDTVKPGLTQYDIGDCLRSCCNPAGEDNADPEAARFDLELAHALLEGYLGEMRALLTYSDFAYIYDACRLITFELGLRFFSDYLAGNRYFKVGDPEHNLRRALLQFHLVASIESRERQFRTIIKTLT